MEKAIEVESLLQGKTGKEKQDIVVDYLVKSFDIPGIPNTIEDPIKRAAFGFFADLAVEKLNWLNNWDFAGKTLNSEQINKLAESIDAPVAIPEMTTVKAASASENTDDKFDKLSQSIAFTLKWEGGKNYTGKANGKYVMKNPADKSGPTNMGIIRSTLAAACAQGIVKHNNLDILTIDKAGEIYRKNCWNRYGWNELTWPSCLLALDCSVNHGRFALILQLACNNLGAKLDADGKYGPQTRTILIELSVHKPQELAQAIANQRKIYYDDIVARDSGQKANLKGWYNRLKDLAADCELESPIK